MQTASLRMTRPWQVARKDCRSAEISHILHLESESGQFGFLVLLVRILIEIHMVYLITAATCPGDRRMHTVTWIMCDLLRCTSRHRITVSASHHTKWKLAVFGVYLLTLHSVASGKVRNLSQKSYVSNQMLTSRVLQPQIWRSAAAY